MTLGEKIKTYRKMRGLTQKELGLRVGFSESTADSRIRKYENNLMKPKVELRKKLAKVLDVNISVLSDIDISSEEDVMQVLFLFENQYGATIKRAENENKKFILEFITSEHNTVLNMYMLEWVKRYEQYLCDGDEITYQDWKAKISIYSQN